MKEGRRVLVLAALLILGLATLIWLFSEFGPQFLPEEAQSRLIWFGIAIPAAVALLAGLKDILELIDRFRGEQHHPTTVAIASCLRAYYNPEVFAHAFSEWDNDNSFRRFFIILSRRKSL